MKYIFLPSTCTVKITVIRSKVIKKKTDLIIYAYTRSFDYNTNQYTINYKNNNSLSIFDKNIINNNIMILSYIVNRHILYNTRIKKMTKWDEIIHNYFQCNYYLFSL